MSLLSRPTQVNWGLFSGTPLMNSRTHLLLFRLALLMAAGLCAPSPPRAGCGDYVVLGGAHPTHAAPMPVEPFDLSRTNLPTPPPKPCSGPSCSGHLPALPLAPVTPVNAPAQEWACAICSLQGIATSCA